MAPRASGIVVTARSAPRGRPERRDFRLLAITVELHVFHDELNWEEPLKLGVEISGQRFIRMWQQRGDRVGFDRQALQPEDFGAAGRVEVHDITDRLYPGIRNIEVSEVRVVETGDEPVGLALLGSGRNAFCLWIDEGRLNWGEEAALGSSRAGEGARIGGLLSGCPLLWEG